MTWRDVKIGGGMVLSALLVASIGATAVASATPDAGTPLILGSVRLESRCLPPGSSAGLRLSYALNSPARVTFTLQRRTTAGLHTPSVCPKQLAFGKNDAQYADVGSTDIDNLAGPLYATVQQPGTVTAGSPTRRAAVASAARAPRALTRTVSARRGRHTSRVLRVLGAAQDLSPGRYRIVMNAVRSDGSRSGPATVWFWVLRSS